MEKLSFAFRNFRRERTNICTNALRCSPFAKLVLELNLNSARFDFKINLMQIATAFPQIERCSGCWNIALPVLHQHPFFFFIVACLVYFSLYGWSIAIRSYKSSTLKFLLQPRSEDQGSAALIYGWKKAGTLLLANQLFKSKYKVRNKLEKYAQNLLILLCGCERPVCSKFERSIWEIGSSKNWAIQTLCTFSSSIIPFSR